MDKGDDEDVPRASAPSLNPLDTAVMRFQSEHDFESHLAGTTPPSVSNSGNSFAETPYGPGLVSSSMDAAEEGLPLNSPAAAYMPSQEQYYACNVMGYTSFGQGYGMPAASSSTAWSGPSSHGAPSMPPLVWAENANSARSFAARVGGGSGWTPLDHRAHHHHAPSLGEQEILGNDQNGGILSFSPSSSGYGSNISEPSHPEGTSPPVDHVSTQYFKSDTPGGSKKYHMQARSSEEEQGGESISGPSSADADSNASDPSDTPSDSWSQKFEQLKEYKRENGHTDVPQKYERLGSWVNKQRMEKKKLDRKQKTSMTAERKELLDGIDFKWAKPKGQEAWDRRFNELVEYKRVHGDCNVPTKYRDNPALGRWVTSQRSDKKHGRISKSNERKLKRIGFVWCRYGEIC